MGERIILKPLCHVRVPSRNLASYFIMLSLGFPSVKWNHNAYLQDLRYILLSV